MHTWKFKPLYLQVGWRGRRQAPKGGRAAFAGRGKVNREKNYKQNQDLLFGVKRKWEKGRITSRV